MSFPSDATIRAARERLVQILRRVRYCPLGHRFFFERRATGLHLVCPRCLTAHRVSIIRLPLPGAAR